MFGISFAELTVIFLLVLVVMGPEKLPEVARWVGKGLRQLRETSNMVRNALEMEDLQRRNSSSAATDQSTSDGSTETDSAAATPPGSLDQVDDTDFEQMLDRKIQSQRLDTVSVSLQPTRPTGDLDTAELPDGDGADPEALFDVAVPLSISSEAT